MFSIGLVLELLEKTNNLGFLFLISQQLMAFQPSSLILLQSLFHSALSGRCIPVAVDKELV